MQVRVPGKVMLSGEYAVLFGGTAVLVPVPRYLTLTAIDEPSPDQKNPVIFQALRESIPELSEQEHDLPPLHVLADRSEFEFTDMDGTTQKLGIGGSAAEAVATIAMRFKRCGFDWETIPEQIHRYADSAHRRAQGGIGSGADVAVIAYRQPIRFKRQNDQVEISVITQPPAHFTPQLTLLWTGTPANTRDMVDSFQSWANSYPNSEALLNLLNGLADELSNEWFTSEKPGLFPALDQFENTLESLSDLAEMQWQLPIHKQLGHWARELGGRAKPTGAGGGDMILIVGDLPVHERTEFTLKLDPFAGD
jgi:mevalonate kinase